MRHSATLLAAVLMLVPAAALAQTTQTTSFQSDQADQPDQTTQTLPPTPPQQKPHHEGIGIGIKGGPLFANISSADAITGLTYSNKSGFIGGLFIGGNRAGRVGVGVDLLYAMKGSKTSAGNLDLNYIDVPIYARINIGSESTSGVSAYVTIGGYVDALLKANNSIIGDVKNNYQEADYGATVGFGVEITRFLIEARYYRGLGNIAKMTGTTALHDKTKSFALMVGFRFN